MAKGVCKALLFVAILLISASNAFGEELSSNRKLLANPQTLLDWRSNVGYERTVPLGTKLTFTWLPGPKTGIQQIAYPGICTNGVAAQPVKFDKGIIKASGTKGAAAAGKVTLQFNALGNYIITSRNRGECEAKWLMITVV